MSTYDHDDSRPAIDYNSPDWHRIVKFLEELKSDSTKIVLGHGVSERDADFHRGRVLQIDMILEWSPYAGR